MTADNAPIYNILGERVALGPLRRDLLPRYYAWINNFETSRYISPIPRPWTLEAETRWFEDAVASETGMIFTIYERADARPIGTTSLLGLDLRNRTAEFGVMIGEPDARGKGLGTETTRFTDIIYMDCLASEFESAALARIFVPDESR